MRTSPLNHPRPLSVSLARFSSSLAVTAALSLAGSHAAKGGADGGASKPLNSADLWSVNADWIGGQLEWSGQTLAFGRTGTLGYLGAWGRTLGAASSTVSGVAPTGTSPGLVSSINSTLAPVAKSSFGGTLGGTRNGMTSTDPVLQLSRSVAAPTDGFATAGGIAAAGVLDINVVANTTTNGLSERTFATPGTSNDTTTINFSGTALSTAEVANLNSTTVVPGITTNGAAQFLGKLQITNAGGYRFFTASDDGSRIFIDGVLVVNNDGSKGIVDLGSATLTLSAGLHDIRVDYIQGTGGLGETLSWSGAAGLDVGAIETAIPTTSLFTAETNTLTGSSNAVIVGAGLGNAVNVNTTSTVNLNGTQFTQAQVGDLTFSSSSPLVVNGLAGKTLRAAGNITLVAGSALNNVPDVAFDGAVSDGGVAMTLTKSGAGRLILDQTTVSNSLLAGTQLEIQAGSLVLVGSTAAGAFNPLGAAGIRLNGGTLVLDTKGGGPVFNNAINVLDNATIQDIGNAVIATMGGTGNGITIAAGKTLTLDAIAGGQLTGALAGDPGATLKIAGPISGGATTTIAITSTVIGSNPIVSKGIVAFAGNNSGFTGTILVPANATLQFYGQAAVGGASVTLSGGTLGLLSDGNGTGTPETFVYTTPITATGSNTIAVGRTAAGTLFTQAANKTIQLASLNPGAFTLTINNSNGYGLEFTGPTALTSNAIYSVSTASSSNVVQGFTLSGPVSGAFDIIKTGAGALVLGDNTASNNFGGAGHLIDIQGGIVAAGSDAALGNLANGIKLNINAATLAGFRATGTFGTSRTFTLSQASNAIEVTAGNTFTLNSAFVGTSGTTTLVKNDNGTLVLAAANPATWTGVVSGVPSAVAGTLVGGVLVNAGVVRLTDGGALGATTNPIVVNVSTGAAVQVANNITVPNPIVLNPTIGNFGSGGINYGGQLQSVSGTNTWSGALLLNQDAGVSADLGSTLNLTGGAQLNAHILFFGGAGNINVTTTGITLPHSVYKIGTGTTTIQAPIGVTTGIGVTAFTGNLTFSGNGTLAAGGKVVTVHASAALNVDDSGTAMVSRLGVNPLTFLGGALNYTGNATADSNETVGATIFNRGMAPVTVTAGTGQSNFTFGTITRTSNGTALFRGTGLGTVAGAGVATIKSGTTGFAFVGAGAAGTTTKGIIPWALVDSSATGFGTSFATADAATGILRPLNSATEMVTNLFTTGTNVLVTGAPATSNSVTINSLTLGGGGAVALNNGQTLTITSGGIFVQGGSATISGGILTAAAADVIAHTLGDLTLNSTMTGTGGLTKDGAGILTLGRQNFATGNVNIYQGTLKLAAGNNTLFPNQFVVLTGGTLDLNGAAQQVFGFLTDGNIAGEGGTVTGNAASTLVINQDNAARNFAGQSTGGLTLLHTGFNQNWVVQNTLGHSGATILAGGTTFIRDNSTLANTSSIDLNFAGLTIDNTSQSNNNNRINDAAAIISRGGLITFQGRAQTASSEKLGALTIGAGSSDINVVAGGTGVNSAELTFSSLSQTANGTLNFRGASGLIGSTTRTLFATAPVLVNNIMAPWAVSGGNEFVSYNPTYGVGNLNAVGFAGYDGTVLPAVSQPTQNIRLVASATVAAGGQTLNTLNLVGNVSLSFVNDSDVLNLTAGGLLKSGNNTISIGVNPESGLLTAGGSASTGTIPLYIHNNSALANPMTVNSRIVNNPNGAAVRLVYTTYNGGSLVLGSSSNSYTGGTVVNGWIGNATGNLTIGSNANLPAGGLTINNGNVIQLFGGVIDPDTVVTLNGPATLTLSGDNRLGGLTFNDLGGSTTNPTVTTSGILTLGGNIASNPLNIASVATINGSLDLGGVVRTISVTPYTVNGQNLGPINSGLTIAATIANGGISKTGGGNLLLSGVNTFAGGVNVSGGGIIIGANSTQAGAAVVSGPVGTGTLTMGADTTLLTTGNFTIANPLVLQGNLSFLSTIAAANSLVFNGNISLPGNLTVSIPNPNSTLRLLATNSLSSNVTKTGAGNLVVNSLSGTITLPGGGPVSFLSDGDGTGTPNVAQQFGGIIASGSATTVTVDRLGTTFAPLFPLAANKTIQFTTAFESGGNAVSIINLNGYGLESLVPVVLVANQTYSVGTASASNVTAGLTLTGAVSGGFGIVKLGAGTLVLRNAGNTFGDGSTSTIDIQGGIVAAASDGALGNLNNQIVLNTNLATASGLRATGTFETSRTIRLAQALNAIEVTTGNTLTVSSSFSLGAPTNALAKNDNGTLKINASNPAWTGGLTINTGVVAVDNPLLTSPLGTGTVAIGPAIATTGGGAAVQLSGGVTITGTTLAFTGQNQASGINFGGGLQSVSGTNTWAGPITATTTGQYYGANAGAVLNVSPSTWTSTANSTSFVGAGTINITTAIPNITPITKYGTGTLNINAASPLFVGPLVINAGNVTVGGSGVAIGITGLITVNPSGSLTVDDSVGASTANRLGARAVTLNGGTFTYTGNAVGSSRVDLQACKLEYSIVSPK